MPVPAHLHLGRFVVPEGVAVEEEVHVLWPVAHRRAPHRAKLAESLEQAHLHRGPVPKSSHHHRPGAPSREPQDRSRPLRSRAKEIRGHRPRRLGGPRRACPGAGRGSFGWPRWLRARRLGPRPSSWPSAPKARHHSTRRPLSGPQTWRPGVGHGHLGQAKLRRQPRDSLVLRTAAGRP